MEELNIECNDENRLKTLKAYRILDSAHEEDYDNLTSLASEICGTPVSLISLIDKQRQWFKSHIGIELRETPREYSFCSTALECQEDVLVIPDARSDKRFSNNPMVKNSPNIVFYTGVVLKAENGLPLGTLCVIDYKTRNLEEWQLRALKRLAQQAEKLLQLRRANYENSQLNEKLKAKNDDLEHFVMVLTHDIKSPINNIRGAISLLQDDIKQKINKEEFDYIQRIDKTLHYLKNLVENLLGYYRSESSDVSQRDTIRTRKMIHMLREAYTMEAETDLVLFTSLNEIKVNASGLEQILLNLIDNATKFNDKPRAHIEISIDQSGDHYIFKVSDNGPGISEDYVNDIFEPFKTNHLDGMGYGIGLASVKKLITRLGGNISVETQIDEGTTFTFTLPKPG